MKQLILTLIFFPIVCAAQKISIGIGAGAAFFSPVNTTPPSIISDVPLKPSFYTAFDLSLGLSEKIDARFAVSISDIQSEPLQLPGIKQKVTAIYARNMKNAMLRLNRTFAEGFYFGITYGRSCYNNPDSASIMLNYKDRVTATDKGAGSVMGAQFGYRHPIAGSPVCIGGEAGFLYGRMTAYKTIKGEQYWGNYAYTVFPVSPSISFRLNEDNTTPKEKKEKEQPKKRGRSYEEEEWGR